MLAIHHFAAEDLFALACCDMARELTQPDFNAIYFDSNILIGYRWPATTRPELHNLLRFASWWNIPTFFPDAVLHEVEAHWRREFEKAASQLKSAARKLSRATVPAASEVVATYLPAGTVIERFGQASTEAIAQLGIRRVEFPQRSAQELFRFATTYEKPFSVDGEGKGFQDVVILLSVLDHVRDHDDVRGVLVTDDGDFKNLNYSVFTPGFDVARLQILDLKTAFNRLFEPYFDQTRVRPYRRLREAAEQMAQAKMDEMREFVASRITSDMFRPSIGDTIIQVLALDKLDIRRVDLPFPDETPKDVSINVTISIMTTCRVVVSTDFAWLRALSGELNTSPASPTEREKLATSFGLIQATGIVVNGELKELRLAELTRDDS